MATSQKPPCPDRLLRPGDYTLRLKIEDVHSKHGTIEEHRFTVDPALAMTREERGLEGVGVEAAGPGAAA